MGDLPAVHLELMAKVVDSVADCRDSDSGGLGGGWIWNCGQRMDLGYIAASLVILALEVFLGDLDVDHGHSDVTMAEDFLQGGKADAGTEHRRGEGMSQLVKANWRAAGSFGGIFESLLHPAVVDAFAVWKHQEGRRCGIGRIGFERSGQCQDATKGFACVFIHGDPAFGVEFSKRNMECPLVSAQMTQRIAV